LPSVSSTGSQGNLKYRIYCTARSGVHALRRSIPSALLPPRRNLGSSFAVGITTYSPRYERYFRSLYAAVSRILPEVPVAVAVNGHGTAAEQACYLDRFQREICAAAPSHHRFVLYDQPHGLTTLWNALLAASPQDLPLLILNDDLAMSPWFRRWAERFDWHSHQLAMLNSSWSHFVIAPGALQRLGAFDPGFPGIGFEDMDYTARAGIAGVPIANPACAYLRHDDDKPASTSFDSQSGRVWGKYTSANQEHFSARWEPCSEGEGVWIKQLHGWVRPRQAVTPFPLPAIPPQAWNGTLLYPDRPA
jgi:hypothetical protein